MTDSEPTKSAWELYIPDDSEPWNLQRVVHLHRRAGFAASWPVIERDLAAGPHAAVDRLLSGANRDEKASTEFEAMSRTIGDAAVASGSPSRLKAWWLYRMLFSPDPLGERLTLMWHNHFATSNRKVQDLAMMREQNDAMRLHASGSFGDLLRSVVKQPAMLIWLDAESNRSGHPNENLAREMMELSTLGAGHYTESDVAKPPVRSPAGRSPRANSVSRPRGMTMAKRRCSDIGTGSGATISCPCFWSNLRRRAESRSVSAIHCWEKVTSVTVSSPSLPMAFINANSTLVGQSRKCCDRNGSLPPLRYGDGSVDRSNGRLACLKHSNCAIRRRVRCYWRSGRDAWDKICFIRRT